MTIKTSVKLPAVNDAGKIDANTIDKVTNSDGSIETASITLSTAEPDDSVGEDGDIWVQYKVKPSYNYYGVKIQINNSSPDGALTYTDDAEGMKPGWSNWKDTPIFKNIKPCVVKDGVVQYYLQRDDYSKKEDGSPSTLDSTTAGDVMVEIPKLGYKMTKDDNYHYIQVTNDPEAEGYCYLAHSKNSPGDCDYIYVGAYLGYVSSSKLYSISGQPPTGSKSLTQFRVYANDRGSNYELFSFYPLTLLQCLFLLIYKNRDSQTALGQGYVSSSSRRATGVTNSNSFNFGSTSKTSAIKFLGIEDFWGNCHQWIDGLYCNSSYQLCTYYKNFTNTDSGTSPDYTLASGKTTDSSGYLTEIVGSNNGGFTLKKSNGSSSTYYCDMNYLFASSCAIFGGNIASDTNAGMFSLKIDQLAPLSDPYVVARLLCKHVAS